MKHSIKRIFTLLLIAACVFSLVSCGKISADEISEGYTRRVSIPTDIEGEETQALYSFGFSVFKEQAVKGGGNKLFSPLSAVACLGLIANGADGETLAQIEGILGCDVDTLNKVTLSYFYDLSRSDSPLNVANSLWINSSKSFSVNEEFLQRNANYYNAQVYSDKFDGDTLKDINRWCDKNTDGMIKEIISDIDDSALIYMINALSFDAEWQTKYESKNVIKSFDFTNYNGSVSSVKALYSEERTYLTDENAVGFIKNYKGNRFCLAALLPNEGVDVYDYIASLSGKRWNEIWKSQAIGEVKVKLPEFKYECETDIAEIMKTLGVSNMFSPESADFSLLGTSEGGNIHCSLFKQKAVIQVDRNGTKAASVSIGSTVDSASPHPTVSVYLDRPFVYAIVDLDTGVPIFIGCVADIS